VSEKSTTTDAPATALDAPPSAGEGASFAQNPGENRSPAAQWDEIASLQAEISDLRLLDRQRQAAMVALAEERNGWRHKAENATPWLARHVRTVTRLIYRIAVYRFGGRLGQAARAAKEVIIPPPAPSSAPTPPALLTRRLVNGNLLAQQRLEALPLEGMPPRLTLVTDTLAAASLSGRVATSVIVAAELAAATGNRLRIVTFDGQTEQIARILAAADIAPGGDVEMIHAGRGEVCRIDFGAQDAFLTTSWRTTYACRDLVPDARITYLIQDDERDLCGAGDDRLRCEEILRSDTLRFIVNSKMLYQHLVSAGFASVARNGKWFEPAFPIQHSNPGRTGTARKTFVFNARPDDGRTLFYRGIEAIDEAVKRGVFRDGAWDFVFAGENFDARLAELPYRPTLLQNPGPDEYAELLRRADIGFSPMDAPHPGSEPLELAAAGAVVVTTASGAKRDLSSYSKNIICAAPDIASLVEALKAAVSLANDAERRWENVRQDGIGRDWRPALRGAIEAVAGRACS
jgi:hypothetical protein